MAWAWPDLTVVPEGSVTQLTWRQDYERHSGLVRFARQMGAAMAAQIR